MPPASGSILPRVAVAERRDRLLLVGRVDVGKGLHSVPPVFRARQAR